MAGVRQLRTFTPAEYLSLERQASYKSEYVAGEIFAMAGANSRHNDICMNLYGLLWSQLRHGPCRTIGSDLRVGAIDSGLYSYPDAGVVCGELAFSDGFKDTVTNPCVLFEVLSPSTQEFDRGDKFARYRAINTLTDYVLVQQTEPGIEHWQKGEGGGWALTNYEGLEPVLPLASISCSLPLSEIYDRVF